MLTIHTTAAAAAATLTTGERTIRADFRQPARSAWINLPTIAWTAATAAMGTEQTAPYLPIVTAALNEAAKGILSANLRPFSVWPAEIDAGYFAPSAMLDAAINAGTEWLSKEELEKAWIASATRAKWTSRTDYATNKALRAAVDKYETLITKMAAKSASYTPDDLDLILAKIEPADLDTIMGAFILRRIEALRAKPADTSVDTDLL
jgi:hypothetical protein